MSRFEEVNDSVVEIFLNVVEDRFSYLGQLKIKLVFDMKRRVKEGKICLAFVELANDKLKFFTKDEVATEGYDAIVFLDHKAWAFASDSDRKRLMSHELRHIFIDENGKVKLLPHDLSDFIAEVKLNQDDPDWAMRLGTVINDMYEQEKEMDREQKKGGSNG